MPQEKVEASVTKKKVEGYWI